MRPILLMEIKKAYKNKLFLLSMLTASLIALYAAVFSIISYHKYVNADSASAALTGYALNPELPGITLFTNWIGADHISPAASLFYLLLPLIASLGYGWSYCSEVKSGYIKNVVTRTSKKNYFLSKYIAVFLSGGTVVAVPILLNTAVVSLFVPAIKPDVFYDVYYAEHPWSTLTPLFYAHPVIYMLLKIIATFIFAGLISELCICVSFLSKNKFVTVFFPLFLFLFINYLSNTIGNIPQISPIQFLHTGKVYVQRGNKISCLRCSVFRLLYRLYIYKGERLGGAHIRRFSLLYNCGYGGIHTYAGKYFYVSGALDAYDFGTAIYHTLLSVL